MFRLLLVHPRNVLCFAGIPEFLHSTQDGCQGRFLLFDPGSLKPQMALHFIRFKSNERKCHVGPAVSISGRRIGSLQISVINIEWELSVRVVLVNLRPWTCSFARPQIEEAELMPHHSSDMDFDGRQIVVGTVSVQTHAFCESYRSPSQC